MSRYTNMYMNGKIVQEHRVVWEQAHGPIPDGFEIHHIDGNGHNNDLANLQLLTRSEHAKLHARLRKEGRDVVDITDPEVITHRNTTRRYCEINKEDRKKKGQEYRKLHKERERERKRKYYIEHRQERLEYNARYKKDHLEEIKKKENENSKRYYAEHIDEIREKRREYNRSHVAENAKRSARYYEAHKDAIDAYRAKYREINRPILRANDKLRAAKRKGAPSEVIAALEAAVEEAKLQVARSKCT